MDSIHQYYDDYTTIWFRVGDGTAAYRVHNSIYPLGASDICGNKVFNFVAARAAVIHRRVESTVQYIIMQILGRFGAVYDTLFKNAVVRWALFCTTSISSWKNEGGRRRNGGSFGWKWALFTAFITDFTTLGYFLSSNWSHGLPWPELNSDPDLTTCTDDLLELGGVHSVIFVG